MKKTLYVLAFTLCTLLVLPAAAQVPSYVPTEGLVGWWPFNGNANAESGNGNDGVVNGATLTEDRFGSAESAYSFDGLDDYILSELLFSAISEDLSISLWVKNESLDQSPRQFFTFGDVVSAPIGIEILPEGYNFIRNLGCGTQSNFYSNLGGLNLWNNVIVSKQAGVVEIFINGQLSNFTDNAVTYNCLNGSLVLGLDIVGNSEFFSGLLDDIAIYNRALTEQEIQNLYTGTTPPPCVSLPSNKASWATGPSAAMPTMKAAMATTVWSAVLR